MGEVRIRWFRNADVPAIVALWNAAMAGKHCAYPLRNDSFQSLILSKLYFDAAGLLVAELNDCIVGMVHAGFGPNEPMDDIDTEYGVVSMILVHPEHQRRGIGTQLAGAAHAYLASRSARVVYAGGIWPMVPFYVGLYGGSEMPGVLSTDQGARQFLEHLGYEPTDGTIILQRPVDGAEPVSDARFRRWRRELEVELSDEYHNTAWWFRQVYGCFEGEQFYLRDRATGELAARGAYWEMVDFAAGLPAPMAGIIDVWVDQSVRRQGIGKYLLGRILRRLEEQFIGTAEIQTMPFNDAALGLYKTLGFQVIGSGTCYKLANLKEHIG